jgi:hypothetical protein
MADARLDGRTLGKLARKLNEAYAGPAGIISPSMQWVWRRVPFDRLGSGLGVEEFRDVSRRLHRQSAAESWGRGYKSPDVQPGTTLWQAFCSKPIQARCCATGAVLVNFSVGQEVG